MYIFLVIFKEGDLLAISPGGVREALFSDENYKMIWNSRIGFAKVALKAQVVSLYFIFQIFNEGHPFNQD